MRVRKKFRWLTRLRHNADTPWMSSMTGQYGEHPASPDGGGKDAPPVSEPNPTIAGFAPNQHGEAQGRSRASVLIHHKTPLLLATPPDVTRALAYSHPFLLPLNHLAGLISWTTGDPWESFLLVAAFWFVTLYGGDVLRYAGPVVFVVFLIYGMYTRRYSPLSSTTWSGEKKKRGKRRQEEQERKSLDEILETLQTFTARCNILLDPLLRLTDFLSTQTTATAATTRPALTTLFIRILLFTPVWILLTLPPLYILTGRRIVLAGGTLFLSWHSRPARVSRTILWRSQTVRNLTALLTGLQFPKPTPTTVTTTSSTAKPAAKALSTSSKPGVRFTFTLYENQRRWLGLGWTASLLAYERQAWTDEHLNTAPEPDQFTLPETEHATTRWRWAEGSQWRVEGATASNEKSAKRIGGGGGGDESGWTYYDNKWRDGRKVDGWGRYTRRRKWVRDAELVEVEPTTPSEAPSDATLVGVDEDASSTSPRKRSGWFARKRTLSDRNNGDRTDAASATNSGISGASRSSRDGPEDDVHTPLRYRESEWGREIGEGMAENLG